MFDNYKAPEDCVCTSATTTGTIIFQIIVLIGLIIMIWLLRKKNPHIIREFFLMAAGILIFEMFTAPMWKNGHLGPWAYIYKDVSWVLCALWSIQFWGFNKLVDHYFKKWKEFRRFGLTVFLITISSILLENVIIHLGIREYSPEVNERLSGIKLVLAPIEMLYYVPVFSGLILGFYKLWNFHLNDVPIVPSLKKVTVTNFVVALISSALFEIMGEPMSINTGFPRWGYFYYDVNIVLTLLWVLIIWITTTIVDRTLMHLNIVNSFILYLFVGTIIYLPIEAALMGAGYSNYSATTSSEFSGIIIPGLGIPFEVCFAIPLYLALIIGLIRYCRIVIENKL